MGINEEDIRAQWRAELARIAAQIADLKVRIDTDSRTLHAQLSAEIAALRFDLRNLESEVDAVPDTHTKQIATQIEDLKAKGDAAYNLLQADMASQLDPTDAEIRRLEAIAATARGDAKRKILTRISELRSARAVARVQGRDDGVSRQQDNPQH